MIDRPWKRWVAAATVSAMLAMPAVPALAANETASSGTVISSVYIRSSAGGGEVLGSVPKGVTVDVLGTSGLWVQVEYKGITGYVFNEYIEVNGAVGDAAVTVTPESFTGTVKAGGSLNVRKGPGTGYSKLGTLTDGAQVKVTGVSGDWYVIDYNGLGGYVSRVYITKAAAQTPAEDEKTKTDKTETAEAFTGTVKVAGSLNVRKGAGTDCAKIGTLKNGASVKVTGVSGDWYVIAYNGASGYVSKDYITRAEAENPDKNETPDTNKNPDKNETPDTDQNPDKNDSGNSTEAFTGTVKVAGSLNVRKGAGTSYAKLGKLKNGASVKVTGSTGEWYAIDYNGATGYVSQSYVTKAGEKDQETVTHEDFEGQVKLTSGSLRMRKGPGTRYSIAATLKNGTQVKVTGSTGEWYAVEYNGTAGYVSKSYIVKVAQDDTQQEPTEETPAETTKGYVCASALNVRKGAGSNQSVLGKLYRGAEVEILSTSGGWCKIKYGNGVGYVSDTYIAAQAQTEPDSTGSDLLNKNLDMTTTLRSGSTGSKVEDLQTALKQKGFYSGKIDGIYDSGVTAAVKVFQKSVGLDDDGVAGEYTLCAAYTLLSPISKSQLKLKAYDNGSSIPIIKPSWSEANSLLPRNASFTVVDVRTGYTYKCIRVGGSLHADVEPATAADTNVMYQSCGAQWSWERRPVWVIYNGIRMAASINCQPHGYETVSGNDMVGQICIHFVNSRTHGGNAVDSSHQACINEAYKAGQ